MLRTDGLPTYQFIKLLSQIEEVITLELMPTGSFAKFIFKSKSNDRWLFIVKNSKTKLYEFDYLENGPWNYYEDLFLQDGTQYISRDIFFDANSLEINRYNTGLYKSCKACAKSVSGDVFASIPRDQAVWNLFAVPHRSKEQNFKINMNLLKKYGQKAQDRFGELLSLGVDKCLLMCASTVKSESSQWNKMLELFLI